jgi:hypothetical protein
MEPERSLPNLKTSANYPYPEPDKSIPRLSSYFLKSRFNIILPATPSSEKLFHSHRFPY